MQLQFGTPTFRKTSKPLNKSNAEQHVMFLTTTQPKHQGALQAWSTNWESLETTRRNDRLTMLYRIQHGFVNIHPDSYLQQSDRRTRGEHRLYQERIGSETYSYSFFPRTIRDWNMLHSGTTSAPTLEGFKANLTVWHPVQHQTAVVAVHSFNRF